MQELNKIQIIDGSFLLHRALHKPDIFDLRNSKGYRTGGIFQFLRMLNTEIRSGGQYFPVVVFDMGLCSRRTTLDPNYKNATERARQDAMVLTPEESDQDYVTQYRKQRNVLSILLPYFGIPAIKFPGYEGDDLMYLLTKMAKESVILTDDRDMLQLLAENVSVRRPMADEFWTLDKFLAETGYTDMYDFVVAKALMGDKSDNIPSSCKGVGDVKVKDMIKIVRQYHKDAENYLTLNTDILQKLCEKAGVKYHKNYQNWNIIRFTINLGLVDLSLVPMDQQIIDSIKATISNTEHQSSYFKVIQTLASLEISDLDIDSIIREVNLRKSYLWFE